MVVKYTVFTVYINYTTKNFFLYVYDTGMQSWMMKNYQKEEDAKEV